MANFKILQEINNIKDGTTVVKKAEQVGGKIASGTLNTAEKTNLVTAINQCFQSASDGKTAIVAALVAMGVSASTNESFSSLAAKIRMIETGIDTGDANAVSGDILKGKTAYVKGMKLTGTIPSRGTATITPGTSNQTIASGQYLSGVQTIAGDADLVTGNIRAGVNLFGVTGKSSVVDTASATAVAGDIASGKTAYVNGVKLTGTLSFKKAIRFVNTLSPRCRIYDYTDDSVLTGQVDGGAQLEVSLNRTIIGSGASEKAVFFIRLSPYSGTINCSSNNATISMIKEVTTYNKIYKIQCDNSIVPVITLAS